MLLAHELGFDQVGWLSRVEEVACLERQSKARRTTLYMSEYHGRTNLSTDSCVWHNQISTTLKDLAFTNSEQQQNIQGTIHHSLSKNMTDNDCSV